MKQVIQATMISAVSAVWGLSAQAATIDLVTNGDFEAGNSGFSTDLMFSPTDLQSTAGTYAITTDGNTLNPFFTSFGDNTTGTGNMMVVNGTTTTGTIAWEQTVSVIAGKTYNFSIWLANAFSGASSELGLVVDGSTLTTATSSAGTSGVWNEHSASWTAALDGSIAIQIVENSTGFSGNDYALDDISFTTEVTTVAPVPLPASAWLLAISLAGIFGLRRKQIA